jgi:formylglycine-generating enzyme required for sulfatase activity
MLGNVWEFCADVYVRDAYRQRAIKGVANNPFSVTGGSSPVRRGGGWFRNASNVRCASRGYELAACVNPHVGFRLVRID